MDYLPTFVLFALPEDRNQKKRKIQFYKFTKM